MTFVDVIKKALLPLAAMAFWLWMVKTIMGVTGNTDLFMFLFLAGLPFGIHKMCIILIPRGYDVGGYCWNDRIECYCGWFIGKPYDPILYCEGSLCDHLVYSKKIMNSRFEAGLRKNKFVSLLFFCAIKLESTKPKLFWICI